MMDVKKKGEKQEEKNDSTGVSLLDFSGLALVSFESLCSRLVRFKYDLATPPPHPRVKDSVSSDTTARRNDEIKTRRKSRLDDQRGKEC